MTDEYNVALRTGPAIAGAGYAGFTLNEWVAILTILYVVLQLGLLVPKYVRMIRQWAGRMTGGGE